MALHLQCGNGHQAYVPDCAPECAAVIGAHLAGCPGTDLDALLVCPPGSGCCDGSKHPGLSHGMAAHLGHPNMAAAVAAGLSEHEPDHEGEHTLANEDCAVCRPMTITIPPSSVTVQPVTGA